MYSASIKLLERFINVLAAISSLDVAGCRLRWERLYNRPHKANCSAWDTPIINQNFQTFSFILSMLIDVLQYYFSCKRHLTASYTDRQRGNEFKCLPVQYG